MVSRIGRRDFIKNSSAAIAGAGLATSSTQSLGQTGGAKSRVIEVFKNGVVNESRKIDGDAVKQMIDAGMKKLSKQKRPWSRFVKPGDRVGIKINTLGRPLIVSHHELIDGIIAELTRAGISPNNIVVWDRFEDHMIRSNFKITPSGNGVRYLASESKAVGTSNYDRKIAYTSSHDRKERRDGNFGTSSPVSNVLLNQCDKIINVPVIKDHGLAGATLCLKNIAYGVTCNNARFHGRDHINTFIADVCAMKAVRKKTVLHILDGLEGCFDNGPLPRDMGSVFAPQSLWFGTDPVAVDAIALKVIEAKRKEKGLPPLPAAGRPASHIDAAAKKGLGTNDPKRIKVVRVNL